MLFKVYEWNRDAGDFFEVGTVEAESAGEAIAKHANEFQGCVTATAYKVGKVYDSRRAEADSIKRRRAERG